MLDRLLDDPGEDPRVVELVRDHLTLRQGLSPNASEKAGRLIALLPQLSNAYARLLCLMNIEILLTWEARYDEAIAWQDRTLESAREIGPLAEASALAVSADTLLEAKRYEDAEAAIRQSDAIAGPLRTSNRDLLKVVRAHLASARGAHAEALDIYARVLTQCELVGDLSAMYVAVASLVRTLARAGRDREMLETVGVTQALVDEWSGRGEVMTAVHAELEPAIAAALDRVGADGAALLKAGRSIEPSERVKRLCALI